MKPFGTAQNATPTETVPSATMTVVTATVHAVMTQIIATWFSDPSPESGLGDSLSKHTTNRD